VRLRRGVVAEEGGDVDAVGGEVAEVEGVEPEACCWEGLWLVFGNSRWEWIGLDWIGEGRVGNVPSTMRVAMR